MRITTLLVLFLGLAVASCGGKPLDPSKWQEPAGEIPPGPGLFSGDDGEFVLYREGRDSGEGAEETEEPSP